MSYMCHCQACQRRTGAVVHSGAYFLKENVKIEGTAKVYERDASEGRKVRCYFCPNCGSNIYFHTDRRPEYINIAVGAFADPTFPAPTWSVWEENKHTWLDLPTGMEHFKQGRT